MILNIETSALACSISIGSNGHNLIDKSSDGEWRHSKEITLLIQDCLKEANVEFKDLNACAVSGGPGSFTGLRVGASAAKGICYAMNIPLIAVDTLKVIASAHKNDLGPHQYIIPMIDARRSEVYYNIYNRQFEAQLETTNLILDGSSLSDFRNYNCLVCGDGAEKASKLLENENFSFISTRANAKHMAFWSYQKYIKEHFEDIAYYSPFYLKPPNITKSKKALF